MALHASVSSKYGVLNEVKVLSDSQRHLTLNKFAPITFKQSERLWILHTALGQFEI